MRLSGSFCCFDFCFALLFGVCATEFLETKSLARLSDYDTTRGYVNGNFIWRYIIGSQHVTFSYFRCLTSSVVCHFNAAVSASSPGHACEHPADERRRLIKAEKPLARYGTFNIICMAAPVFISWLERRGFDSACDATSRFALQSLLPPFAHRSSTFLKTRARDGF